MKKSLIIAVAVTIIILALFAVTPEKSEAQSEFAGRWTQAGVQGVYLVISSVSGNYTAAYIMGQTICRFSDVNISGNTLYMKGWYVSGEGFTTDLVFNLILSDDRITLTGTKWSDTHWTARGVPLHAADTDSVIFMR